MARTKEDGRRFSAGENTHPEPHAHAEYEVKSETGENVGVSILVLYFGDLWQSALNRLGYRFDGHMFTIRHQGKKYSVYRKLEPEADSISYGLTLV